MKEAVVIIGQRRVGWTLSLGIGLVGILGAPASLDATEGTSSVRQRIAARLKVEFPYKPEAGRSEFESESGDVVAMLPYIVEENPDRSRRVAKVLEERRQEAVARKPSLEGGASIDTDRVIIGPRPLADGFAADARFKSDKAITPQWSLFQFRM